MGRRTRSALVGGSATKQLVPVLASLALVPATGKGGRALLMIVALSSQYFAVRMVHWIVETIIETCNQSSLVIVSILAESCLNFIANSPFKQNGDHPVLVGVSCIRATGKEP